METDQERKLAEPARLDRAPYTRTLEEEGLEREFNSLDEQREATEVFI